MTNTNKPFTPIKVAIHMPASVYQALREHADALGSSISALLRASALRELAEADRAAGT